MSQDRADLLVHQDDFVRTLTLNRPERANALSRALIRRLIEEVVAAEDDAGVRVVVFTGSGDKVFCAGADLKEMKDRLDAGTASRPMRGTDRNLFEAIHESRKPTIAAINGHAVAGGLELALACDLRVAVETAKLGMPEAKRGMGANFASVMLPRIIPSSIALQMLLTGESVSAGEAERWGLVNKLVPIAADLLPAARALAEQIAANAPLSVRRMKEIVHKTCDLPMHAALRMDFGPDPYASEDRAEGVKAWSEGRAPQWRGR